MTTEKIVEDGTETEKSATVKVTHYEPAKGVGRLHMTACSGNWSMNDKGLRGSIYVPMGSADVVVTVRRVDANGFEHLFTFDARSLIDAAVAAFEAHK